MIPYIFVFLLTCFLWEYCRCMYDFIIVGVYLVVSMDILEVVGAA